MVSHRAANWVAAVVAVVVLAVGGVLAATLGITLDPPKNTTTVVETGTGAGVGKKSKTVEATGVAKAQGTKGKKGRRQTKRTTTVEEGTGSPSGKKSVTTEEESRSFFERIGGKTGQIMLLLAVIVLAAFLAAALAQRLLLGDYSIKLGGFELAAAQEADTGNIEKLTAGVTKVSDELAKVDRELQERVEAVSDRINGMSDYYSNSVGTAIARLQAQIEQLKKPSEGGSE